LHGNWGTPRVDELHCREEGIVHPVWKVQISDPVMSYSNFFVGLTPRVDEHHCREEDIVHPVWKVQISDPVMGYSNFFVGFFSLFSHIPD